MKPLAWRWGIALLLGLAAWGCRQGNDVAALQELQKVRSGDVEVVLLSRTDALIQGKDSFVLEFRSPADGSLRDVGTVRVNATMPMAGMAPMFGASEASPTATPGRYMVASDFGMAGTWQIKVEWQGPAGTGSATLRGAVR